MRELTFELRQQIREARSKAQRNELGLDRWDAYRARDVPIKRADGRCSGCGTPYEHPQTGCSTCVGREKSRAKRLRGVR